MPRDSRRKAKILNSYGEELDEEMLFKRYLRYKHRLKNDDFRAFRTFICDCVVGSKDIRISQGKIKKRKFKKLVSRFNRVCASDSTDTSRKRAKYVEDDSSKTSSKDLDDQVCDVCDKPGELLICDSCDRAFHLKCVGLKKVPSSEKWFCSNCSQDRPTSSEEVDVKRVLPSNKMLCVNCRKPDDVPLHKCSLCGAFYHLLCFVPPIDANLLLSNNKSKDIVCQLCYNHAALDDLKVDAIVACRTFRVSPSREVVNKYCLINKPYEVNFYLIKIVDLSFWHCFWVDEFNLKMENSSKLRYFTKKIESQTDLVQKLDYVDIKTALSLKNVNVHSKRKKEVLYTDQIYHSLEAVDFLISNNDLNVDLMSDIVIDEHFLKTYFCKYHIKYDWFFIDRILSTEHNQFLVKWRDQNYMSCSWEFDNHPCIKFQPEEFTQAVLVYLSINMNDIYSNSKKKAATAVTIDYSPHEKTKKINSLFKLHQYQVDGVNWLLSSYNDGTNTILADEMGLGKTIQSITFLYKLFNENICRGPFLIVAPLSTINNWEIEFTKWAPKLYVIKFIGSGAERDLISLHDFNAEPIKYNFTKFKSLLFKNVSCADRLNSLVVTDSVQAVKTLNTYFDQYNTSSPNKRNKINSRFHVLLTNYEAITNLTNYFKKTRYQIVLVDEAHRLKNMNSLFFSTMCQLDIDYKCLLTGTPLQNSLEELYNLLFYIDPHDEYIQSKESFLSHFESIDKEQQIVFLKKILGSRMLRRNKEDVLHRLPPKQEIIVPVNLTPKQIEFYKALLAKNYKVITASTATSGNCTLLNIMVQLRKICNHTCIFGQLSQADDLNLLLAGSGKMEFMRRLLEKLYAKQHRVLIFSQMTRMLDLIELFLQHMNYAYERLDGSTKPEMRQAAIERFNKIDSTSFIFLLSTKAGGLGINLASADTVIIYDSDWNPQNDMQALSRAHRLGQNKPVLVFRLVARYTVEEKVIENARSKLLMTNIVVRSAKLVNNYTNRGKSIESMDYFSLNEILKHGTDQLFEKITTDRVDYTDEDIERMLDRNNLNDSKEGENLVMNELLGNFKMAKYSLAENPEQPERADSDDLNNNNNNNNNEKEREDIGKAHEYWEKLLKVEYEKLTLEEQQKYQEEIDNLGKGKRVKNNINYSDFTEKTNKKTKVNDITLDEEYVVENEEASDEFDDSFSIKSPVNKMPPESNLLSNTNIKNLHTSQFDLAGQKSKTPALPPLKATKVSIVLSKEACTEVAASLYRYGYPPMNYDSLVNNWCRHDELKRYSMEEIMRYIGSLLKDVFTLNIENQMVASNDDKETMIMRIATMELVRDKVYQYGYLNDDILPVMYKYMVFGPTAMEEVAVKDRVLNARAVRKSILDRMPPNNASTMEKVCKTYFFNIEDGGYSLLHQHWQMERDSSRLSQIWWRRHDLWLLLAVLVHGHSQYEAILANPDFVVISQVLRSVFSYPSMLSFMGNRFNLLEQALFCERIYIMSQMQDMSTEAKPVYLKRNTTKVTNLLGWHVQAYQVSEQLTRSAGRLLNPEGSKHEIKARVKNMRDQLGWLKELLVLGEAGLASMAEEHSSNKCRNFLRLFKLTNYPLNFMANWKNV